MGTDCYQLWNNVDGVGRHIQAVWLDLDHSWLQTSKMNIELKLLYVRKAIYGMSWLASIAT